MKTDTVALVRHLVAAIAVSRRFWRRTLTGLIQRPEDQHSNLRDALTYVATTAVCLTFLAFYFPLWKVSLRIPLLVNCWDTVFYMGLFKGMTDGGWYLDNSFVGAPLGLNLRDFPLTETWHFAWCKLIACFLKDPVAVYNLYYLLGFPLAGLTATFMLRQLGVGRGPAVVAASLFAFLPFHLQRYGHLFITSYYLLPLSTLVALRICIGPAGSGSTGDRGSSARNGHSWRDFLGAVAVCVMVGLSQVYLAFFSCCLLIAAGLVSVMNRRKLVPLCVAGLLVVVTLSAVAISVLPSFRYWAKNGRNPACARRTPGEGDIYGLKLTQLLLPQRDHRIRLLKRFASYYRETFGWTMSVNENVTASLGVVGTIGFLFLLGRLMYFRGPRLSSPVLDSLSVLALFIFLTVSIGGLASLADYLLFCIKVPFRLRGFNRASVCIGLLALTAVAILLDRLGRSCSGNRATAWAFRCFLLLVLAGGLLDQTGKFGRAQYLEFKRIYRAEAIYVSVMESILAPGTMVLQLPYRSYPECPGILKDVDYDGFRLYLHSKGLRWSYGTMKGREGDRRLQAICGLPALQMVGAAEHAGYGAILVDRRGLVDEGIGLEKDFRALLGEPVVGVDGRYLLFQIAKTTDEGER